MLSFLTNYINNNNIFDENKNILANIPEIKSKIKSQIYDKYDKYSELITTINYFCDLYNNNNKIIVSLSGGVDSMVLTSIIKYLNFEVICVYINYNNRIETKKEEEFLQKWCNYNNIKFYIESIENIKRSTLKRSEYELKSKNIRFDFYKNILKKENVAKIFLAHHKDDIIENIFANICRGRYILDLSVMKEESIINDVCIIRPLINFYKEAIYDFALNNNVPYFKNTTPEWSVRGKYRDKIYPLLVETFSNNIKENLFNLSIQASNWNELITKQMIDPFMDNVIFESNNCSFNVEKYKDNPMCFWNIILMKIFYRYNKNCPSRKAINVFINSISFKNICYISLSDCCICYNKNFNISIRFKILI